MLHDQRLFLTQLVTLLAVLDPVSHLTLFLTTTGSMSRRGRRRAAVLAIPLAFVVLAAFGLLGGEVLHAMGISLLSFQIAGGLIIFVFALSMVLGTGTEARGDGAAPAQSPLTVAVHPLAVPILAGPGSILTVMVLMDNNRYSWPGRLTTLLALAVALGCSWWSSSSAR